eukprot:scaffold1928_cov381-Prasinococcus_capsulatus_cf.AAC.17
MGHGHQQLHPVPQTWNKAQYHRENKWYRPYARKSGRSIQIGWKLDVGQIWPTPMPSFARSRMCQVPFGIEERARLESRRHASLQRTCAQPSLEDRTQAVAVPCENVVGLLLVRASQLPQQRDNFVVLQAGSTQVQPADRGGRESMQETGQQGIRRVGPVRSRVPGTSSSHLRKCASPMNGARQGRHS